jgi:transposase
MFLRRCERKKAGKRHTYWALVESYRTGRGSRQRVVAYLGDLKPTEQTGWAQLARRLDKKQRPQPSLFDPPHYDDPEEDEPVLVQLQGIRLERLRDFGDVWLALGVWRLLGLDRLLATLMPPGREAVPWPTVAAILTLARFCEPSSELHIEETWYRRLAQRGYSRDNRPDCLQVCIGLVVTDDGMPLGYEVFAGNTADAKTIEQIVHAMEQKYGQAQRVWVLDRGMVSEANLEFLRQRGGRYMVGTPRAMLRQFEEHLVERGWREVQEGVEVKLVPGPGGAETFILARSADRRAKEHAMHERFLTRLEAALVRMQHAAESGRLKDADVAQRRLGRLQQRYWRAAAAFEIRVERLSKPAGKARLRIGWTRKRRWSEWAALSEGCYLLRSNLTETDPATLWKRYIQLSDAEWAFRITKDELRIRPIWHQVEARVQAHILVCFLAYAVWKTLGQWMRRAGLGDAPRTLVEELAKIKSGDVVLPAKPRDGRATRHIRLRCVTAPDKSQQVLLHRLGLNLPRRLRRIDEPVPM